MSRSTNPKAQVEFRCTHPKCDFTITLTGTALKYALKPTTTYYHTCWRNKTTYRRLKPLIP